MKKYAIVGTGSRGILSYAVPMAEEYTDCVQIVGACDSNIKRARLVSEYTKVDVPAYTDFDLMLKETKPDVVIVTTRDCAHAEYIIKALEFGCDVISEKPMTTTDEMCSRIIETERRTGHKVTVTFNCRFFPFYVRIKELINEGLLGDILSVHFEWLLDTSHGADYFRRWHRRRENSGSLIIHKSTHHFDLVNWFLEQEPVKVNAYGTRRFYGPTREERSERCLTCPYKNKCEFYVDIHTAEGGNQKRIYLDCEDVDGYYRDGCVFADEIDIEDSVSVNVRYSGGTVMSYSLTAHSPYECMKIVLNGTKGRLEADTAFGKENIKYYNRRGEEFNYNHYNRKPMPGGHGGSDTALRNNLFRGYDSDPLHQMADTRAGAMSIGIGIAANKSMAEDRAVYLSEWLGKYYD
ncbi:MAG: Gfo/Idh/MocA family oxidoreductase [Clostridia bacterium]|nr:Gfo/Idh/MocA family oxidoreductase [Clostridia bacterium]